MPKKDIDAMSLEELEALNQELMAEKESIRERQREVAAAMDARQAEADASRLMESMSEPQKAALAQVVKAEGIKPASKVGTPGGK